MVFHDALQVNQHNCISVLRYPHYHLSPKCMNNSGLQSHRIIVWPMRVLSNHSVEMIEPIRENGIVYYVYTNVYCTGINRYMIQVENNAKAVKEKYWSVTVLFT